VLPYFWLKKYYSPGVGVGAGDGVSPPSSDCPSEPPSSGSDGEGSIPPTGRIQTCRRDSRSKCRGLRHDPGVQLRSCQRSCEQLQLGR